MHLYQLFKKHINVEALVFLCLECKRFLATVDTSINSAATWRKMGPLWNSALSKQTAVSFLPTAHMRSHDPAPSHCTRDYPSAAGWPWSFPPMKLKHEGQLAKTPLLFLEAQAAFPGWGMCPILALWVPWHPSPTAQRPLHFRGVQRSSSTLRMGSASCPPWGLPQPRAHSLWFFGFSSREKGPRQWWLCQHPRRCPGPLSFTAQHRFWGPNPSWRAAGSSAQRSLEVSCWVKGGHQRLGCPMEMQWHHNASW